MASAGVESYPGGARREPTVTFCTENTLVLFNFSSDDETFRSQLLSAIIAGKCPDFERSFGGSGRSYAALWKPEHADAVRAWAQSVGALAGRPKELT